MDTTLLKSFATSARTELIREVGARITAVLAPGSPERVEQHSAVTALERAIAGAGGGDAGKAQAADKVAYTWFNRIIALRFMDANGYTGIGVVSPASDQVGQPEVLATAKRGQIDVDVVKGPNAATVTGLLNGTRQPRSGVDAQAEAYALLLADYCRYWNRSMPFMFEREGDYTELLIPANLLAEDSVLSRSVRVLSEDVCQDVEVIGWLYQFYIAERKDEVFAGFKKNKKAGADEIPAATQLFTPHWIVRYLVENSVGRLWMLNHPESRLVDQMDYYIAPVGEETDFLKITKPQELSVIDPACGSGHMLTYAFDLLYAIYEEEGYTPSQIPGLILTNNLYGTEIDPRAGALAAFALTMKAAAKRKLFLKSPVEPKICVLDPVTFDADELSYLVTADGDRHTEEVFWNQFAEADTFGSLIQPDFVLTIRLTDHLAILGDEGDLLLADALDRAQRVVRQSKYLSQGYVVAIANPPYMGTRNMGARLSSWAKVSYPRSKADLFAMFIERCMDLVKPHGLVAMITMQSWMFLSTYEKLRSKIEEDAPIMAMAHLGTGAFDSIGGEVVATTSFILGVARDRNLEGAFVRLTDERNEESKSGVLRAAGRAASGAVYRVSSADLAQVPGSPVAYWTDAALRGAFSSSTTFGSDFTPRKGNDTGDNSSFLRQWWEVSWSSIGIGMQSRDEARESRRRWFPYNKGGGFRKWYGNFDLVVDWEDDGRRIRSFVDGSGKPRSNLRNQGYYFSEGVTWSDISSSSFAARYLPAGFLCDNSGSACYGSPTTLPSALGFLCSSVAYEMLMTVNPTLHFQAGNLSSLPLRISEAEELPGITTECVAISERDWALRETSWSHRVSPLLLDATMPARVSDRWEEWARDRNVARARLHELEVANNNVWIREFELEGVVSESVDIDEAALARPSREADITALLSYAVGCMFGRYSLEEPGLVLVEQGATLQDYLAKVPSPIFSPDADNVIPIVDGDWFEDDIVERFRQFLRVAFGEQYFEENLHFVTESLGVKNLRDYFVKSFYKDHVQRYKKRPIYWLFSSPKGSFNALIYMHRYTPSTVSTVLTYLREYVTKLESALQQAERAGNAKEADRLRKILVELNEYEHDTLFPKASERVVIDLDDGVKTNYFKFGAALKKIAGLEAASD